MVNPLTDDFRRWVESQETGGNPLTQETWAKDLSRDTWAVRQQQHSLNHQAGCVGSHQGSRCSRYFSCLTRHTGFEELWNEYDLCAFNDCLNLESRLHKHHQQLGFFSGNVLARRLYCVGLHFCLFLGHLDFYDFSRWNAQLGSGQGSTWCNG